MSITNTTSSSEACASPLAKGEKWHRPAPIAPVTERIRQIILKNRLVSKLSRLNYSDWEKLRLETLQALVALPDQAGGS